MYAWSLATMVSICLCHWATILHGLSIGIHWQEDPAVMTIQEFGQPPGRFMGMEIVIHQLLVGTVQNVSMWELTITRCLIIPRGVQFGKELFPEIAILQNHAAPYCYPTTGKEAPFVTVDLFSSTDTIFPVSPETCNCTPLRRWCTLGAQVL